MSSKRRQTLATGLPKARPTKNDAPTMTTRARSSRIPKSRQSMIPRVAGQENGEATSNNVRGPSPSRPRKSMGVTQPTVPSRSGTPSKNRRQSHAPSEQAVYPTDPRVKDKSYLVGAIKKMISYLKKHGYDCSNLNPSKLVSHGVSGRDFNSIMTFLFRRLDPGFNNHTDENIRTDEPPIKFEEEVSLAFKTLGYPLPISKTGIVAVGAPHTWPALIAAIDWLVDMLLVVGEENQLDWDDAVNNDEEIYELQSNTDRAQRQFDAFLRKSYTAFLKDEENVMEDLETDLQEMWEDENGVLDAYLEGVEKEGQKVVQELQQLESEIEGFSEVHKKREQFATDIQTYLALVTEMKNMQADEQTKVSSLTEEKETMEKSIDEVTSNIHRLKDVVSNQELSVEEVRTMERQKVRLEEQCAQKKTVLEGHENALKEAKEKYAKCLQLLKQTVEEYNAKAKNLELVPETAKNAHGVKMGICLNEASAVNSVEGLLGVDMDKVATHLNKVGNGYEKKFKEEKRRDKELKEKIVVMKKEQVEMGQEIVTKKDNIKIRQQEITMEQEKLQSELQSKQRQLQLLQSKITTLHDPSSTQSTIVKNDKRYQDLLALEKKQDEEIVANKKAVADEIRKAVETAVEYEKFVKKAIEERNAYVEKKKKELQQMELPEERC